ncbi:MAG: hypothetical protein AB7O28_00590 [Vicinamibacterales bacterium]
MTTRLPLTLLVVASCFAGHSAFAQVQDNNRSAWAVTSQLFDVTRVDNTLYVAGVPQMGVAYSDDSTEPFLFVDPVTGAPTATVFTASVPRDGSVNAMVSDGSGGWYVGGNFTRIGSGGGSGWSGLAHLTPPTVDMTFKPSVNGLVNGLWRQGSTLYLVGRFDQVNGQARGGGAAFDVTTGALLPWNPALDTASNGNNAAAIIVSGSTVFLGGNFTTASGNARPGFAVVDATTGALLGTPATTLSTGAVVGALALSGNTLYLGGMFTAIGAVTRANFGAIDITNGNVLAFQADTNSPVRKLLIDGSRVYVGGNFTFMAGQPRGGLARVDAGTGALDAWSPGANGAVTALYLNGSTLHAGGGFSRIGGTPRVGVAALSTTTGAALHFNTGVGGGVVNQLVPSGADLIVAGNYTHGAAVSRPGVAAIDLVTNELLPFTIDISGQVRGITASGNTLYLAGAFTTVNGQARMNFAAVDRRTGEVLPWNPNASGIIGSNLGGRTVAVSGGVAYIGGYFTTVGGAGRVGFAAVDAVTGAVLPFTADTTAGGINRLVLSGQTLYLGGNFTGIGGQARQGLAAFDLTTPTPTLTPLAITLTSGVTPAINAMKIAGSTMYLAGLFSSVNGTSRFSAAAITLPGGAVTAFAPGLNGQAFDIDVLGPVAYLAGGFSQVNGFFRPSYAAVDAATGSVLPFVANIPAGVGNRVIAAPEGLVAVGNIFGANFNFFPASGLAGLPGRPTAPTAFLMPGQALFLGWGPPAVGGDVTSYRLEIGTGRGLANIATIPTSDDNPSFDYIGAVPPGTYYARVRGVSAKGVGPASQDMAFTVAGSACLGPWPSPIPTATVNGGAVTISWPDPVASAPMTYDLSASTVSGSVNIGTFPMGAAQQFAAAAPPGAYFLRVQGRNACGIPAASPELLVSVGGVFPLDAPTLTAQVSAGVVSLNWTAVPGAAGYRLEAGLGPLDSSIARLPLAGTSVGGAVPPGTYYLRVYALGGPTGESHASNEAVLVVP